MKHFFLLVTFLLFISCNNSEHSIAKEKLVTSIIAKELKSKININEKIKIIDVRTEKEYYSDVGHIDRSILMPLNNIVTSIKEIKKMEEEIFVICLSGKRSSLAAKILRQNGIYARNVQGGMLDWNKLNN